MKNIKKLIGLSAALMTALAFSLFTFVAVPAPVSAAETGIGSGTLYHTISYKTGQSADTLSLGDKILLVNTGTTYNPVSKADPYYVGLTLPNGFAARGDVVTAPEDTENPGSTSTWAAHPDTCFAVNFDLRETGVMDDHNGWLYPSASGLTNAWDFHCTGGGNRGTYYVYTLSSTPFDSDNVTVTEQAPFPTNGSISSANLILSVSAGGKTKTLLSSEYTIPDHQIDVAEGDCTYTVGIGDVTITKFSPHKADSVIEGLTSLTDTEEGNYKTALGSATNDNDVKLILAKARGVNSVRVQATASKESIDNMSNFIDNEQTTKKSAIDTALESAVSAINNAANVAFASTEANNDVNAIKLIQAQAQAYNDINAKAAVETAKIEALTNLSPAEKNAEKQKIEVFVSDAKTNVDNATLAKIAGVVTGAANYSEGITDEATVMDFNKANLTDKNGNLFGAVSSNNVDKILASETPFNALTASQKVLVDDSVDTVDVYENYAELLAAAKAFVTEQADNFVKKYLSAPSNSIYKYVDKGNYKQILLGKSAWANLSQAEKDAINEILALNGNDKYEDMLTDAQYLADQDKTASTGDDNNVALWAVLMLLLTGTIIVFMSKKRYNR